MTITIDTTDRRDQRALRILAGASRWLQARTRDGRSVWLIPSESKAGAYHLVTTRECDCQDRQRTGLACKHIRAARLRVAEIKAGR